MRKRMKRRTFLHAAAGAAALHFASKSMFAATGSQVSVYRTGAGKRHVAETPLAWQASVPATATEIAIDGGETMQPILGFGAAFTDSACLVLNGMPSTARAHWMEELFSPGKMNLSVGRCSVGASDYSKSLYSYDDRAGDTELKHFSTEHDDAYILPILREARQLNPELFLLASTWSPPAWMKVYGTMLGGYMSERHLEDYARYYVRYLEDYAAKGVPLQALTTGNEVEAEQGGSMPATFWTAEMEADFVRDHMGPLLAKHGFKTQVWLCDHNYNLTRRVEWQMKDEALRRYVSGIAWHGYVGTADMLSELHAQMPDVPFYWTEGGPDINDPQYSYDWVRWGQTFTAAMRNWCRCIIGWNLALDPSGGPNIGPFQCGGLITVTPGGEVKESGQYWTMRHFSEHLRRGAVRVASHGDATSMSHIAFRNPDGGYVCVLTNAGGRREARLTMGGHALAVTLEENSVTTLAWSAPMA